MTREQALAIAREPGVTRPRAELVLALVTLRRELERDESHALEDLRKRGVA